MECTVHDCEDIGGEGGVQLTSISATDSPHSVRSEGTDSVTESGVLDEIKEEINVELELMPKTIHYQPSLSDFSDDSPEDGDVNEADGKTLGIPGTEDTIELVPQDDKKVQPGTQSDQCLGTEDAVEEDLNVIKNDVEILDHVEEVGEPGVDDAENLDDRNGKELMTLDHDLDSDGVSQDGENETGNEDEIGDVPLVGSNPAVDQDPTNDDADWDVDVTLDHGLDTDDELDERLVLERDDDDTNAPAGESLSANRVKGPSMADSDPEVMVGVPGDSLDFDVTKEHGLNSDNEDVEDDQEDEDTDAPPKKKKKFKPWKMIRKVFKKGKKTVPDEKTETIDDEGQVLSTKQVIPSESSVSRNVGDGLEKEDSQLPAGEISRRESDEGLPLSPESPSLNFDLDETGHREESLGDSGDLSLDVEERNNSQVHKGLYHPTPSPRLSLRHNSEERSKGDFDSVTTSPTLNNDAAKHKISVKPSTRRPTSKYRSSPQRTTPTAFDFDANSFSFASESKCNGNKIINRDYSYLVNRPVPRPPPGPHLSRRPMFSPRRGRTMRMGNFSYKVIPTWAQTLNPPMEESELDCSLSSSSSESSDDRSSLEDSLLLNECSDTQEVEITDINTMIGRWSHANEGIDEESEMEEKSAMSIALERKDMEGSREGKRPLNGILDQLIEESKEAYTYDIAPVEVNSSDDHMSRLNEQEENVGSKEADDKFMFNSQTATLEEKRENGGAGQDEEKIQEAEEKAEEDDNKRDNVMENDIPEGVEVEKKSEIDTVRVEVGFPAEIESVVVISEGIRDGKDKNQNDIDEHTIKVKDIEVTKVNQEDDVTSSNEEEAEIKMSVAEATPLEVSEEKEDKIKEEEKPVIEEDKPVIKEERNGGVKEKPSPTPRPRSTPQIKPRVSFASNNNLEETKDLNDNEERPMSVKDRISRFQSKSFTSETIAPAKRAPRRTIPKSKPSTPNPAPAERKLTVPAATSNSVQKGKVETPPKLSRGERAKSTPERRQLPVQQRPTEKFEKESTRVTPPKRLSPPLQRSESQNEESNIQSRGGVRALIMKFQETKPQVNSGTRAAKLVAS